MYNKERKEKMNKKNYDKEEVTLFKHYPNAENTSKKKKKTKKKKRKENNLRTLFF